MGNRWRLWAAFVALLIASITTPASASATRTFEGTCEVSGPIVPERPVNLIPRIGARASYRGHGTCQGRLDARAARTWKVRVRVDDADILFDTCELGPDIGIPATMLIRVRRKRVAEFPLTLDMVRVATAGPVLIRGPHDGAAFGLAQLIPADQAAAVAACADPNGGLSDAALAASFRTLSPLVGYWSPL
jgi:hypothetical protein